MNVITRWFLAVLAALVFIPASRAQMSAPPVETRVLLIFDTSSGMKKRVPDEVKAIKQLFALALAERLQNGDTIGVWTFNSDVHTGEFPLQRWQVQNITPTASAVISFIQAQHYSKTTSFDKLTPLINHVVAVSPQLLVIIFCDGEGQFTGTPFDNSINAAFKEHVKDMRNAHEPFVIALRGEGGQYSGSTISSAEEINIPHFAPLSPSPQFVAPQLAAPTPPHAPAPAQAVPPPLIIVGHPAGTKPAPPQPAPDLIIKGTNRLPDPPATSTQKNANPQSSVVPETNTVPPAALSSAPTNAVVSSEQTVSPPPAAAPSQQTANPPATIASTASPGPVAVPAETGKGRLFIVIGGIFIVVGVPVWMILSRSRNHSSGSLITEGLKKR